MRYLLFVLTLLVFVSRGALATDECKCEVTCYKNGSAHGVASMSYNRDTRSTMFGHGCGQDADVSRKFSGYLFCQTPREVAVDTCSSNCKGGLFSSDRYSCSTATCGSR